LPPPSVVGGGDKPYETGPKEPGRHTLSLLSAPAKKVLTLAESLVDKGF